ncbi:nitroreductase family protein [Clostridium cylindrosporum]|uniref:Putative nitroreductase Nfs n=1 Tax=Clostridium cylindrosporum DSM 605 TaxID=1121307 RepID=A0A0J8D8S2_CLOCY|nr:nitroreductase family protein [Clostridium cylindrosporum]KMT22277.1 putative nitroreductase Nfs [Clostridium cylindrosporum DSM 605]
MGDYIFNKPITEIIKARTSVRTYNSESLSKDISEKIENYIKEIRNPFNKNLRIKLINMDKLDGKQKLGTYGMIKGAKSFIGITHKEGELAEVALGYEFECLVLYATSLGLGTCWMGGTFNKSQFSKVMELEEGEVFPIVSPIGYKGDSRSVFESIVKFTAKSSKRRDFSEGFFKSNFNMALTKEAAGKYYTPLEMFRLAPSAVNKQPWSN